MSELHKISAGGGTPQADVIFVHGLDGHQFTTWQQDPDRQTDCWLHWLADDAPAGAIHTLEYAARSSEWLGQAMPLGDRAKEVLNELAHRGIGRRPVVFVCHSLGGLLVKQLLRTASDDAAESRWRAIADQTKGVVFLATPHAGADLARTLRRIGWALRTSPAIDDLRPHASALRELNEWYRGFVKPRQVRTLCYYETYRTMATRFRWLPVTIKVVDEADADPGVDGARPMPLDADHISICKPRRRDDKLCAAVSDLVRGIAPQAPRNDQPGPVGPLRIGADQLPADLGDFEGRGEEIAKLKAILTSGAKQAAVTAIGGMGGLGKSALAVHVAHLLAQEAPDGRVFVDLGGTTGTPFAPIEPTARGAPLTAVQAMLKVIGALAPALPVPKEEDAAARAYREVLDGKRVLLLLDNAEDSAQVRPLLDWRAPTTMVVITSRRRVTAPGLQAIDLDVMVPDEARALLRTVLGARAANVAEVAQIVERCGRLPLALRAAGTYLANNPHEKVDSYLEALADEKKRLRRLRIEDDASLDVYAALALRARRLAEENPELEALAAARGVPGELRWRGGGGGVGDRDGRRRSRPRRSAPAQHGAVGRGRRSLAAARPDARRGRGTAGWAGPGNAGGAAGGGAGKARATLLHGARGRRRPLLEG